MKRFFGICAAIVAIFALVSTVAFASEDDPQLTPDLQRIEDRTWNGTSFRDTPELGDSSMGIITLLSFSGLALVGAVVAHKKAQSSVR